MNLDATFTWILSLRLTFYLEITEYLKTSSEESLTLLGLSNHLQMPKEREFS
jgi:hypothetical protein